ncbi:hypothetical protein JRQ81_008966 [Phrynocephalus forsythii]|uniref:GAG-pre-integrase domain-containing protein n=1 Tax=Phrynocephalus forsythii TaxID=171643 RepID=A0A9Q1AT46_9SAUR|nr:hypothetical protein JRQ81_008966 [Phrynocephalus forsythii]
MASFGLSEGAPWGSEGSRPRRKRPYLSPSPPHEEEEEEEEGWGGPWGDRDERGRPREEEEEEEEGRRAPESYAVEAEREKEASLELWHRRFAHPDAKALLELQKRNLGIGLKVDGSGADLEVVPSAPESKGPGLWPCRRSRGGVPKCWT